MIVHVKLLTGDLIELNVDSNDTIDTNDIRKALSRFNTKQFPYERTVISPCSEPNLFMAFVQPSPTEVLLSTYEGVDNDYLYNNQTTNDSKKFRCVLRIGLDLFNEECCTWQVSVMATKVFDLTQDHVFSKQHVDMKRLANDMQAFFIMTKQKSHFSYMGAPNILSITRAPSKPDLSKYVYGATKCFNGNEHLTSGGITEWYDNLREALTAPFTIIFSQETVEEYDDMSLHVYDENDGEKINGDIHFTYWLNSDEIDRLVLLSSEQFACLDEHEKSRMNFWV